LLEKIEEIRIKINKDEEKKLESEEKISKQ
jgi:hypothetical protein